MFVVNTIVGVLVSRLGTSLFGNNTPSENTSVQTAPADDQAFLASLAHLSPEERQRRIRTREWYKRLAQRQGIIEIEENADHYWRSGSEK